MSHGFTSTWMKTKIATCVFNIGSKDHGFTRLGLRNTIMPTVNSSKFRKDIQRCDQKAYPLRLSNQNAGEGPKQEKKGHVTAVDKYIFSRCENS